MTRTRVLRGSDEWDSDRASGCGVVRDPLGENGRIHDPATATPLSFREAVSSPDFEVT